MGIQPREQRRPRRAATGRVVKLREPQPVGGERIEIRRLDLAAVAAQIAEAHVISENDDDIGSTRFRGPQRRRHHHQYGTYQALQ
jgi:hypothetical protein